MDQIASLHIVTVRGMQGVKLIQLPASILTCCHVAFVRARPPSGSGAGTLCNEIQAKSVVLQQCCGRPTS